jgi:hypothetical protein
MDQVARADGQAADAHRAVEIHDVAVAVRADRGIREDRKAEAANLVEIAVRAGK